MKLILAVALGGAIGAVARYQSIGALTRWLGLGFPYGTLFVNVLGSFLAGLFLEFLATKLNSSPELRVFFAVGVLGAFTTFSGFALDVSVLTERANLLASGAYVALSVVLSIAGLFFGFWLMRSFLA
ncbi:MAG: fluoride efflux transporter CrcB [Alphaproteobacteria bacterium]|nr:fluoride efflux transporter CrcB [Alphaproteobacteria bacterium]